MSNKYYSICMEYKASKKDSVIWYAQEFEHNKSQINYVHMKFKLIFNTTEECEEEILNRISKKGGVLISRAQYRKTKGE